MKKNPLSKNFVKKCAFATVALSLATTVAPNAQIPQAYWQYQTPFQNAVKANNKAEILRTANAIIDVFKNQPLDKDKAGNLYNAYGALYPVYESMGQYDKAIECLKEYNSYAKYLGFNDAAKTSAKRALAIDPRTEVYALTKDTSKTPYYGAKNEPKSGTYWGRVKSEISDEPMESESIIGFYVEFARDNIEDFDYIIRPYANGDYVLSIALNMPQENASLSQVLSPASDSYIQKTAEYLNSLNCPVLLRIGGEMNVWTNLADPESYKQAYIKIANVMRAKAPNVALVFSPNDISNWNADIQSYYPGDAYADWVGVSLYTNKYKNPYDPKAGSDENEAYYGNGLYANPISKLSEIVSLYGDKKPVIITEGATGHKIKDSEDLSDFAKNRVKMLYTYVNMVYPQVKGVIYFDQDLASSKYDYALNHSAKVKEAYKSATSANKALISGDSAEYAYVKAENYKDNLSELNLYTYCVLPGNIMAYVNYYLDGNKVGSYSAMPFNHTIKSADITAGNHSVKVEIKGENGYNKVKEYNLVKAADGTITMTAK